jgi:hypothetical protein
LQKERPLCVSEESEEEEEPYRMPPTRLPEAQIHHIEQIVITYLDKNPSISNTELRALADIRYDQATYFFNRMLEEGPPATITGFFTVRSVPGTAL